MRVAILAGDGIGPEVMAQAERLLDAVSSRFSLGVEKSYALVGGAAYDCHGSHLPQQTLDICKQSDAILFGSVGGPIAESDDPKWKNCEVNALLGIRKAFGFFANIRPCDVYPELASSCPLKDSLIRDGTSILIVRELLGDLYFGAKKRSSSQNGRVASDLCEYSEEQICNIAKTAFSAASQRRKSLISVDKANVLETSRLWREIMNETATGYPDVKLQHMLVDNCAMQLVKNPAQFDVIVTSNMFGDILSDLASVLPGSLGMTPSASINSQGFGLYEPSGGSAPDIAGKDIANPCAQILSVALMLRFSFGLDNPAQAIENAVRLAIKSGARTADIAGEGQRILSTHEFTDKILACL